MTQHAKSQTFALDSKPGIEPRSERPSLAACFELLKPITWFPPMWAFMCGVVSSGVSLTENWALLIAGMILAGPLLCGMSQAVNDWYDRHVDAINEPNRPIPSGRMPGKWGFYIACVWSILALSVAAFLGPWVFVVAFLGTLLAWAYSAPPLRLKQNGWWGNSAVAISYEGFAWFTGAAVMLAAFPDWRIVLFAGLYSFGAHGIMTLNDFKSIKGDQQMGVRSLPVQLGPERAAKVACIMMVLPQIIVVTLLLAWQQTIAGVIVLAFLGAQLSFMTRLLSDVRKYAPWYNATGVMVYVLGMLVSAFALRSLILGG